MANTLGSSVPGDGSSSGARRIDLGLNASMLNGPQWAQTGSFSPTSAASKQKNMFSSGYAGPEYSVQEMVRFYKPSDLPKSMGGGSVPTALLTQVSQSPVLSQPFDRLQAAQLWKRKVRSGSSDQTELAPAAPLITGLRNPLESSEPLMPAKTPGRSKFDMIAQSQMAERASSDNRFGMHRPQSVQRSSSSDAFGGRSRANPLSNKWQRGMRAPEATWNAPRGGQTINTRSPRDNWQQMYNPGSHGALQSQRRIGQVWSNKSPRTGALEDEPDEDNADLLEVSGKSDEFARMALKTQELEKERAAYTNKYPAANEAWSDDGGDPVKDPEPEPVPLVMIEKVWWYKDPKGNVQGPFSSNDMRKWYNGNFFTSALPIRFRADGKFSPLGECYPDPSVAFTVQPKSQNLAPPPGLPAPRGGMFDNFGVGVAAKAPAEPSISTPLQNTDELYDTFGTGVQETDKPVQTRQLEKPAWASFGGNPGASGRPLEPDVSAARAPLRDQYQNQVRNVAPNSAWRPMQAQNPAPAPAPAPAAPAPAPAVFKSENVWGKSAPAPTPNKEHVTLGGATIPHGAAPQPEPTPTSIPNVPAQQIAQRNAWGAPVTAPTTAPQNLKSESEQRQFASQQQPTHQLQQQTQSQIPQQQRQQQRQPPQPQISQQQQQIQHHQPQIPHQRQQRPHHQQHHQKQHTQQQQQQQNQIQQPQMFQSKQSSSTMVTKAAPEPAAAKANVWADAAATKPQRTLLEIQQEQAVEEAKRAKERAKEQARAANEAEEQRRKGVWGAQKSKPKSFAEIQMEEEMNRKMQTEAAGRRKKVAPQKNSWAGLAASGTPAAWSGPAGPTTDRKNEWPTVGNQQESSNWPAVGNKPAPSPVNSSQWPNLSSGPAKSKPAPNTSDNNANKWGAASQQPQRPQKQQFVAKPKANSVWGNKAARAKSLSDIQREQQSRQDDNSWPQQNPSGELAQMRNNLKSMLGIGGGRGNPAASAAGARGAWGNTSAGPAVGQPLSIREIQAEEARRKSQNRAPSSRSGGWAAKVSGSKATVWGGSAQVRAKPMAEILNEESQKAALENSVQTPSGSGPSTGAKEDELLWGGVQLDPSSLASSPPPQPKPQRQQQQHQPKPKPSNAFGGPTMSPGFRRWCVQEMIRLSGHDDTTLVDYCFTLQSPAEIRESMSGTLGSTPGVSQFATEFIKRKKDQMSHSNRRNNSANSRGRGGSGGGRRNRRRPHRNNRR